MVPIPKMRRSSGRRQSHWAGTLWPTSARESLLAGLFFGGPLTEMTQMINHWHLDFISRPKMSVVANSYFRDRKHFITKWTIFGFIISPIVNSRDVKQRSYGSVRNTSNYRCVVVLYNASTDFDTVQALRQGLSARTSMPFTCNFARGILGCNLLLLFFAFRFFLLFCCLLRAVSYLATKSRTSAQQEMPAL